MTGAEETTPEDAAPDLDAGTYEVLRTRLSKHAQELARRAETLNARRVESFGGAELRLVGTHRIRTEHNCVARDVVAVGDDVLLFGYNASMGMKTDTGVNDVLAAHRVTTSEEGLRFEPAEPSAVSGLLGAPRFTADFAELYRYYRGSRLLQLRRKDGKLLAVFQTGKRVSDVRVLRWTLGTDGSVEYLDARGERDHAFPPSHDFEWTPTTREQHVTGRHPHISIHDEVFVECVGGTLTVKTENNTESGEGIYAEPVAEKLQSLADAEVHYARLGPVIVLRVLPYNEAQWRHLVFNTRTKSVTRLDGIGQACRRLPEDQGIIFPDGYYLSSGVVRTFDTDPAGLEFEAAVRSPDGEDVLYAFHERKEGRTLLLAYNVLREEVATPISCHGYALFDDGTMMVIRAESDEPTRVHPVQVWHTPFMSDTYAAAQSTSGGPLERIGNAELVRGISDCLSVSRAVQEMTPTTGTFQALIAACRRASDSHHWLGEEELGDLAAPLADVRAAAEQVLDEHEKVQALTRQAHEALQHAEDNTASLLRNARAATPRSAGEWVRQLTSLRRAQGALAGLREMRYVDTSRVEQLDRTLGEELGAAGRRAVEFLRDAEAYAAYHEEVRRLEEEAEDVATAAEAAPLDERLGEQAGGLEVVTDVIGSLEIPDATVRTEILEHIGEVLGAVNRARAALDARRRSLRDREGRAQFAAEFALLGQAITAGLAAADSPQAADEHLGRLLLQVENLEARFAEFDDYLGELETKREDIYEAFSARKQTMLDERARRADRLAGSAQRILGNVRRRAAELESLEEVNTYFASDAMVARLHSTAQELRDLGETVRAEELDGRITAARQEAGRALHDRLELFDGADTIRLGRHRFAVNTQPVELTLVPHQGRMAFTVTGTDFRSPVRDEGFQRTRHLWERRVVSESGQVYRAEYLAVRLLSSAEQGEEGLGLDDLHESAARGHLAEVVRRHAEQRYDEGYERGVHDHDAALILEALLQLHAGAELLRYPAEQRAAAQLYWAFGCEEGERRAWRTRSRSLARASRLFPRSSPSETEKLAAELSAAIRGFLERVGLAEQFPGAAGEYLTRELARDTQDFARSAEAQELLAGLDASLERGGVETRRTLDGDLANLDRPEDLSARCRLTQAWLRSYLDDTADGGRHLLPALNEAAVLLVVDGHVDHYDSPAVLTETVYGLLGSHPRITQRALTLRLDEVLARVNRFHREEVPAFRSYQRRRHELVEAERARLRLGEYVPQVMSGFVRNELLDQVYLPLIGDNLAKQLGATGEAKRTDNSGLLLLISPPGYGKTTLMEYVASRLGLVFVKVNGPALGQEVTSVDPADAPNATARQEVEKISFALEMGNNVLLYLDDIQHANPELLQKFISLCDAQRRMEGVWEGRTRTYDLRGKRFAVCMAGNPYTESGQRFRVPDMLANRADVWNLGEVLSGRDELFALSYIENALTANPVLAPLSSRTREDVRLLVRMARGDSTVQADRLDHPYSAVELEQILAVLGKLLRVQQVVLACNQSYIASAAQDDAARTEPPFLLQGSYRNMNALAERVLPVTSDAELEAAIDDHYRGEAQTLTSGAEANLLKLAELRGTLTAEQEQRWSQVKDAYRRAKAMAGDGADPMNRAIGAVGLLADRVGGVQEAIEKARP